jgi:type 1 glutamine amidotransferase
MNRRIVHAVAGILIAAASMSFGEAAQVRVLIIDGESAGPYHRWQVTTPVLKKILDETQLFQVEIVTVGAAGPAEPFTPSFAGHGAVVLNYDAPDERWPPALKREFERYVEDGGGVVVVHAADNAFPGWKAYNEMIGVGGWRNRNENAGPRWFVENGKLTSDPAPGPAGSHGTRLPFAITVQDPNHPITRGLPKVWMHQGDELYASLRGPGQHMIVLATAHSDPSNHGTGRDEPTLIVVQHGRGRVFHTTLGHDVNAMSSVDFVTTLQRGTEWAATGAVTQKPPPSFPTADTVSYRADLAAMDPAYRNGLNPLDPPRR